MASGRQVVGEKDRTTAIVPLRLPAEDAEELEDPRLSDVDEWGRSERTRAVARAIYEPVYSKWFRTEWEGLEKIPGEGGTLLVANHAGAIPSDAPVIMHGIEKELERPVYGLADYFFRTVPVVGTLWARAGGVSARPANAYRLLKEQRQLALVFPEGTKGPSKSYTDRYQLRRFGRSGFVEIAIRAGVPVIPIAVIGSEEAMPVVLRLPTLARALGVPYFPITANLLAFGPVGVIAPFPAKFKLRVLDPVQFDVPPDQDRYSKSRIMEESEHIRTQLQEAVYDMLRDRRSVWFGWSRRVLVTGADTFWGGRMIQALETDPSMDVILGMGTHAPSVPFERAEFVRTDQNYSILNRIVKATQVDTILHTFMITNSMTVPRRAMHEINVIGTMNLLAAAGTAGSSVRHIVVKSSTLVYGSAASDPNTFLEDTPRTSPVKNSVERALVEAEGLVRDFSEDNPATKVTVLRFANVLGPHLTTPISRNLSRPVCPSIFGFDPLLQFVEEDDVVRALAHVTVGGIPGLYNVAADGRLPWSEVATICGTRLVPLSPYSPFKIRPVARLFDLPSELEDLLRYGRGVDTRRFAATGFAYNATSAGAVRTFIRAVRLRRQSGRQPMSYTYEHDIEQFFRHSPSVVSTSEA